MSYYSSKKTVKNTTDFSFILTSKNLEKDLTNKLRKVTALFFFEYKEYFGDYEYLIKKEREMICLVFMHVANYLRLNKRSEAESLFSDFIFKYFDIIEKLTDKAIMKLKRGKATYIKKHYKVNLELIKSQIQVYPILIKYSFLFNNYHLGAILVKKYYEKYILQLVNIIETLNKLRVQTIDSYANINYQNLSDIIIRKSCYLALNFIINYYFINGNLYKKLISFLKDYYINFRTCINTNFEEDYKQNNSKEYILRYENEIEISYKLLYNCTLLFVQLNDKELEDLSENITMFFRCNFKSQKIHYFTLKYKKIILFLILNYRIKQRQMDKIKNIKQLIESNEKEYIQLIGDTDKNECKFENKLLSEKDIHLLNTCLNLNENINNSNSSDEDTIEEYDMNVYEDLINEGSKMIVFLDSLSKDQLDILNKCQLEGQFTYQLPIFFPPDFRCTLSEQQSEMLDEIKQFTITKEYLLYNINERIELDNINPNLIYLIKYRQFNDSTDEYLVLNVMNIIDYLKKTNVINEEDYNVINKNKKKFSTFFYALNDDDKHVLCNENDKDKIELIIQKFKLCLGDNK